MTTATLEIPQAIVQQAIVGADYSYAVGQIDVYEAGELVRSCRFRHDVCQQVLWVRCLVESLTYRGDSRRGWLDRADGRSVPTVSATEPRDIPSWLLRPISAPIWGRPGDGWRLDAAELSWSGELIQIPLRSMRDNDPDGFVELHWPDAYFTQLRVGTELYVLKQLDAHH